MIFRLIPAPWMDSSAKVKEGEFTDAEIHRLNSQGYNIYYLPNYPSAYEPGTIVRGSDIDIFNWVFVDCDLKDGRYPTKEAFYETLADSNIPPTKIVDSGHGVHAYWQIENLDVKSYLRFQRRLVRLFNTDDATTSIYQLLRVPGTINTKKKDAPKACELVYATDVSYTAEELDRALPPITVEDEKLCVQHYDRTFNLNQTEIVEKLPAKFGPFLLSNPEAKELFAGEVEDRSKADFRLGHLLFANGFTRSEALSVLVNTVKAMSRSPIHRNSYAQNIVDKIYTFEETKNELQLSKSVRNILQRSGETTAGARFPCHPCLDNTDHGFRLGQVIGFVAGSGVGKTAVTLNMFRWFVERNPDYDHFFVSLEQPEDEIAKRWQTMCGMDSSLHDKVHVIGNYDDTGEFRNLSLDEIQDYLIEFQKKTGKKVGCVVIDHIGALAKKGTDDEQQDLLTICHKMKAFAVQTNTLLIMQSQTSREKAGIGDLELDKDAAFGTSSFEWYCDFLITMWQPLKRCHAEEACPTVTAFKFCKIRHKKQKKDVIQEDVPYYLYFDTETELLRDLTEDEKVSFKYFLPKATNKRKIDRKTGIVEYKSVPYTKEPNDAGTNSN